MYNEKFFLQLLQIIALSKCLLLFPSKRILLFPSSGENLLPMIPQCFSQLTHRFLGFIEIMTQSFVEHFIQPHRSFGRITLKGGEYFTRMLISVVKIYEL